MAGGQGTRLHPLTRDRAKPAVPFGGVKWSGVGVENGLPGLHEFSDVHVIHTARG